jgi:hypothetical protein
MDRLVLELYEGQSEIRNLFTGSTRLLTLWRLWNRSELEGVRVENTRCMK